MSCSAFGNRPRYLWLRPVCGLEVEDDQIGEVGPMLVLAAENKQFVAFIQCCSMS